MSRHEKRNSKSPIWAILVMVMREKMKKIVFSMLIGMFAIFNAHASDKEQITDLINTIKNAPAGSITTNYISEDDDCVRMLINKDGVPIFYWRACFDIKEFDINNIFTIYNDDGTETEIKGGYQKFKELIDIVPKPKEHDMKNEIFGEMCDGNANGFYILSENDNEITVEYYAESNESETHVFPKIFDKDGVKVYFGGDKDIFVNNKGKWKNYGHKCTEMEYQSVTQKSDSGEIRIVWYKEKRDPNILVDLAADADPWGFSDIALVYQEFDKNPSVFLRKAYDSMYFENCDMWIKYAEDDNGNIDWKTNLGMKKMKSKKSAPSTLDELKESVQDGFEIKHVTRYNKGFDGYTGVVDVYNVVPTKNTTSVFIAMTYWIHNNKIIKKMPVKMFDIQPGTDMVSNLIDVLKNAPRENLTVRKINTTDDCWHKVVAKDGVDLFKISGCFSIGLRLKGFDPVEFATYEITPYGENPQTKYYNYAEVKDLIDIISDLEKSN